MTFVYSVVSWQEMQWVQLAFIKLAEVMSDLYYPGHFTAC